MSKYDEERKKLGIYNANSQVMQKSKYDEERQQMQKAQDVLSQNYDMSSPQGMQRAINNIGGSSVLSNRQLGDFTPTRESLNIGQPQQPKIIYNPASLEYYDDKNAFTKFLGKAGGTFNEMMGIQDERTNIDVGNTAGNFGASLYGGIMSLASPGAVGALGKGISQAGRIGENLVTKLIPKANTTLGRLATKGATEGLAYSFPKGLADLTDNKKTLGQVGLDTAINTGLGIGAELGLYGLGKGANKLLSKTLNKNTIDNVDSALNTPLKQTEIPTPATSFTETPKESILDSFIGNETGAVNIGTKAKQEMPEYMTSRTEKANNTFGDKVRKVYYKTVDNLARLKDVDETTYQKAINSRSSDAIANRNLQDVMVDSKGNVVGESFANVTKQVPKGKDVEFSDYLLLKNARDKMLQGKQVFKEDSPMNTIEAVENKIKQYESEIPEFIELQQRAVEWQRNLAEKWLVDTGLIDKQTFANWIETNPNYVPFQRGFSELEKRGAKGMSKNSFVNQSSTVKQMKGSGRQIIDPIESIIENSFKFVKSAKRNEVGQELVKAIQKNPEAYKGFAEIVDNKKMLIDDINKLLDEDGVDGLADKLTEQFDSAFVKGKTNTDNFVNVLMDGKQVQLKVNDIDLLDALTNLNPQQQPGWINSVGKVTRMMKTLTTGINPAFGLARNLWRDIATGYINSKTIDANYGKYIYDLIGSMVDIVGNKQAYQSYKNMGGGFNASSISADRNLMAESKAKLLPDYFKSGNGLQNLGRVGGNIVSKIEQMNNVLETAPRLAEFKRVIKQGGDTAENRAKALYESGDVTVNFSKFGDTTKSLDALTPYLNAAVQGMDKLARTYKDKPVEATIKSLMGVTLPTMILYAVNRNDPNYKMLSESQKANYFNIPNGNGTFTKIPKPREIGVVFGDLPERLMRQWADNDPKAFDKFSKDIIQNFSPPNPITDNILMPGVKTFANKEGIDWRGNPIVNQSMLNLSPRYQYDENTSEPAKFIGDKLNISPKKIDNISKSYLGGLAQFGIPATTKNNSIEKTLVKQVTADPLYNNDILNDFYAKAEKLKTIATDKNFTQKINPSVVTKEEQLSNAMQKASKQISDIRKDMKSIMASNDPNRENKLREKQKQMLEIAKKYIDK